MRSIRWLSLPLLLVVAASCGKDSSSGGTPLGGALMVSGDVIDFKTGAAITGAASVSTVGLLPAPRVTVQGSTFVVEDVPANSQFQVIASAAPTHVTTYDPAIYVKTSDVDGVKAYAVSEEYLTALATGYSVTPSSTKGVLLLHLVDSAGNPKAGIAGSNLVLAGTSASSGPHFLGADLSAAAGTVSSASGWAVFFDVAPGAVSLGQAATATVTLQMATSTVAAASVTIADVVVADGAPAPLPTNVSFSQQIFPIFSNRGCVACHSGNGAGRDLGGLTLDGSANLVYKELTQETTTRVVLAAPETSRVLTMPSAETPPDAHPNVTFQSPQDPDYLKILVWIREGAKAN